ncbi:MAG: 2-hydroxychromene-2-carboxylate isomerase [Minwuia sp.]|nr:2-hydroxychromene-2-carboxylate isomerase [Minwuia sp.]
MTKEIEFWFDFSSPYAYLASERIEDLAAKHGRSVAWRPFLLGIAFRAEGTKPLTHYDAKGRYSTHDFARSARLWNIPFAMPDPFPAAAQDASRLFIWLDRHQPQQAVPFLHAIYRAYFVGNRFIGDRAVVLQVASETGIDTDQAARAIADQGIKDRLRELTQEAVGDKGVFGAPTMIVDGELFWGADRIDMLDQWMTRGGW